MRIQKSKREKCSVEGYATCMCMLATCSCAIQTCVCACQTGNPVQTDKNEAYTRVNRFRYASASSSGGRTESMRA